MIKLITFATDSEKLLEFNFKDCSINYFQKTNWINVISQKQKITIQGNSFIAYDEDILGIMVDSSYLSLCKKWIELFYKDNDKVILVSSREDKPLYLFRGKDISVVTAGSNFLHFKIDGKDLYLNDLHWLLLTKNLDEVI